MRKFVAFVLFFTLLFPGTLKLLAQKKNKLRLIRMEVTSGNTDNFHMVPMGQNGLLVFYETNQINDQGKRLWYFALFDIHLKQKWLRPVPLTDRLYYIKQKQTDGEVYFVFRHSDKLKKGTGYYDILMYNKKEQSFKSIRGSMPLKVQIADFAVQGKMLCMGLNLTDNKADALFVNTATGAINVVHLNELQKVAVDGVFSNNSAGNIVIVANSLDTKSTIRHIVYSFRSDGTAVQKVDISYFDPMSRLDKFTLAEASGNNLKFFGAYHITAKGGFLSGNNNEDNPDTEGFFYLSIENGKQKDLRQFNFLDFKNIQGTFMQSEYHRSNKGKKKASEEHPGTVSLLDITHPFVFRTRDGFIVAADAYLPYYKSESHMEYDFYGNMYPTNYRVFAGYQFYDIILAGFTREGKMMWDNDFPMQNILSYKIENKALVYPDSTITTLAYVTGGQIITQDIYRDKKLDSREKINIASRYSRDRPVGGGESKLVHWYDKYFLVYGYQQLKNRALQNQPLRTVFYINKVALQ